MTTRNYGWFELELYTPSDDRIQNTDIYITINQYENDIESIENDTSLISKIDNNNEIYGKISKESICDHMIFQSTEKTSYIDKKDDLKISIDNHINIDVINEPCIDIYCVIEKHDIDDYTVITNEQISSSIKKVSDININVDNIDDIMSKE